MVSLKLFQVCTCSFMEVLPFMQSMWSACECFDLANFMVEKNANCQAIFHVLTFLSNKNTSYAILRNLKRNGYGSPIQQHLHAEITICIAQPDQQVTVFFFFWSGISILILRFN